MENQGNTQSINTILKQIIQENHLNYGIDKVRVGQAWHKIAGQEVLRCTTKVNLQGTSLYIELNSAALREELSYKKEEFISLINKELNQEIVKQIIIR